MKEPAAAGIVVRIVPDPCQSSVVRDV